MFSSGGISSFLWRLWSASDDVLRAASSLFCSLMRLALPIFSVHSCQPGPSERRVLVTACRCGRSASPIRVGGAPRPSKLAWERRPSVGFRDAAGASAGALTLGAANVRVPCAARDAEAVFRGRPVRLALFSAARLQAQVESASEKTLLGADADAGAHQLSKVFAVEPLVIRQGEVELVPVRR